MAGMFDDLVPAAPNGSAPATPQNGGMFADLVPSTDLDWSRPVETIRADIAKLPEKQRRVALDKWAKSYVNKEHEDSPKMMAAADKMRQIARGTPVGSWMDEASAYLNDKLFNIPYDEGVAYQRERDRQADERSTKLGTVPVPLLGDVDVTTGGVAKLGGAAASAAMAPFLRVFQGNAVLPTMGNALINGGLYGGVYGAGEGEGGERIANAGKGMAIGSVLGPAAVPVARGLGNAFGYAAEKLRGTPQELAQMPKDTRNALVRAYRDDMLDRPGAQSYGTQAAELGPEGMLMDMGANLRGQASAIAAMPGEGNQLIRGELFRRREGAPQRIVADVNNALGPPVNVPQSIEATRQAASAAARPYRQQFENSPVPYTQDLQDIAEHIAENHPNILGDARRLSNDAAFATGAPNQPQFFAQQGPNGQWIINRVPNAAEWDHVKRAFDNMAQSRGATRTDQLLYGNAARRVREAVDRAVSPNDPAASPWAQARAIEGESFGIQDAFTAGQEAFRKGYTPDQMQMDMARLTPHERQAYQMGARDQVRTIMGEASTQWGPNGDSAARSRLGSEFAREKVGMIAGQAPAQRLINRLDAESRFAGTNQRVTANSETAGREAAKKEFPNPADATMPENIGAGGFEGAAMRGMHKIMDTLVGGAMSEQRARVAAEAARALTAQGATRDALARAIESYVASRNLTPAQQQSLGRMFQLMGEGARAPMVDDAANARQRGNRRAR